MSFKNRQKAAKVARAEILQLCAVFFSGFLLDQEFPACDAVKQGLALDWCEAEIVEPINMLDEFYTWGLVCA